VAQDTHIPEAESVAVPAQAREFLGHWRPKRDAQAGDPPRRPLRLFETPEEITVNFTEVPDGPPGYFRWRQCQHQIVRAEGPERIALEWWKEKPHDRLVLPEEREERIEEGEEAVPPCPSRDYFRIETREGLRFWLYRDGAWRQNGLRPRWYLQGVFA
jgi:protein ImuB